MADFDFPDDVIELRRAYDVADAKVNDLIERGVSGEELQAARDERLRFVGLLYSHPRFETVDQFKAREALKVAARGSATPAE